ncbi:hypothetical protein LCGC14_2034940, partial [marine sediment metagenome]
MIMPLLFESKLPVGSSARIMSGELA